MDVDPDEWPQPEPVYFDTPPMDGDETEDISPHLLRAENWKQSLPRPAEVAQRIESIIHFMHSLGINLAILLENLTYTNKYAD
jgi:hypothetical protein